MEKFKKYLPLLVLVVVAIALLVWTSIETGGSDSYNYEGYIIDIRETDEGTVLTTLSGHTQSEFVVKWNTRAKYNGDIKELRIGDCIKLSTAKNSDRNIKKFSVYSGFSLEGKIVYTEGQASPFLLTTSATTKAYRLYSLIATQDTAAIPQAGTQTKIYFQYPINAATTSIVVDIIQPVSDIPSPLTEAEIAYIKLMGYTVSTP